MQKPIQNKNYQVERSTVINLEKGKIPPQAVDLEFSVLSACLKDRHAFLEVVEIIKDQREVFYQEKHKYIFDAMYEMFTESEGIDLLTVSDRLKKQGKLDLIGGDYYLIELSQKVASSSHIEFWSRILMQKYVQRESIKVASSIIENAYHDEVDIFDLLEESQRSLDETSQWLLKKKAENLQTVFSKFIDNQNNPTSGIPSKYKKINIMCGGYHPTDLVIVAARPGMGKTALVVNEAKFQAEQNVPVGFITLEMSDIQLLGRMFSIEFGIESNRIKQKKLTISEKQVIKKEGEKISKLPLYIHDASGITVMEAKIVIGKWVRESGVRIVYIDYLQLMKGFSGDKNKGNREQEISHISRTLKAIAKEFEICIVALSQLSRAVETRGGSKRPILSDLRESGAIEQDADTVYFIYRPEYYKIDEWDDDDRGSCINQMEIDAAKLREGEPARTRLKCDLKYMRIENMEDFIPDYPKPLPPQEPNTAFHEPVKNDLPNDEDDLPF